MGSPVHSIISYFQMVKLFVQRLCAGIHYANASLFITIVSILAGFNITMCKDGDGNDIVPTTEGVRNSLA